MKPKKLTRRELPSGFSENDFKYMGRAAKEQHDFGQDVGIADMACVDQFGAGNKNKYYHAGVVSAKNKWFVYLEWGRIFAGKSWQNGYCLGQDYQFVECDSEESARDFFEKQCSSKNTKRLEEKEIGGVKLWVGKNGKDGYVVQSLATREKGLPDATTIKDDSGVVQEVKQKKQTKKKPKGPKVKYQPQTIALAQALVSGVRQYARAAIASTGISPTMEAIEKVRNELIPLAGKRIAAVGNNIDDQLKDQELIDISTLVATIVPRPISRGGSQRSRQESIILSANNIASIRDDLDTFEAALKNEDFEEIENEESDIDPHTIIVGNGEVVWIDPNSIKGRWIKGTYLSMSNNRHGYLQKNPNILNIFEIRRPDRDSKFLEYAKQIADKNKNNKIDCLARLQPSSRDDISDISDIAKQANVFLGIHGTRSVNVQPILSSNLRLPKSLPGAQITGAAFGHGIYWATDWRKSYGYTGHGRAYYGNGGQVKGRGFFMFLADVVMGDPYKATNTGSWNAPPNNKDSIAAYPDFMSYLQNDEHIVFNTNAHRIRYLIEADFD